MWTRTEPVRRRAAQYAAMRTPDPLPDALRGAPAFSVADAVALGVDRGRLSRGGLVRPFHGVRAQLLPATVEERCLAYIPRLRAGQFFSHATAAQLHGMPLPARVRGDERIHVATFRPLQPPRARGVVGHQLIGRPGLLGWVGPFPTTSPAESWCLLAADLGVDALVVAADHLVRHGVPHPDDVVLELRDAATQLRRTGVDRLARALALVRPGVRSPMESVLRVVIVLAGLPEPEINVRISDAFGRFLGEGDLVYRDARLLLEYEGDGHRTDVDQFRKDIRRRERFEDAGWTVLRITADDVFRHRDELLDRIRRRLAAPLR